MVVVVQCETWSFYCYLHHEMNEHLVKIFLLDMTCGFSELKVISSNKCKLKVSLQNITSPWSKVSPIFLFFVLHSIIIILNTNWRTKDGKGWGQVLWAIVMYLSRADLNDQWNKGSSTEAIQNLFQECPEAERYRVGRARHMQWGWVEKIRQRVVIWSWCRSFKNYPNEY